MRLQSCFRAADSTLPEGRIDLQASLSTPLLTLIGSSGCELTAKVRGPADDS